MSKESEILREKIKAQEEHLDRWKQPVEPLLFETLRAIDNLICQELFFPDNSPNRLPFPEYSIATWGINKALARMVPDELGRGPFKLFPSNRTIQGQADELLFQAGVLEKAERLFGWIAEGLVSVRLDVPPESLPSGIKQILVLKSQHPGIFREVISRKHRAWISDRVVEFDQDWEAKIAERHAEIVPELERNLEAFQGWGIAYTTTEKIDEHFLECGQVYLRRMWSQDLLGLEDKIGGNQFNEYLGLLAALSGRAQKHLCFASMLKQRQPELDLRNLLTTFVPHDDFITSLARHLDAETLQIQKLLSSLMLDPSNKEIHADSGETAWAPVIRSSHEFCILPLYGLEINPFLFLLNDLEAKYPDDWFRVANNREKRWLVDLRFIFPSARWKVIDRNVKLRHNGRTVTDIDFMAYDISSNEIAILQLKWQRPVGMDNRARRSAGKNLITTGNKWVEAVCDWLDTYGVKELANRAGFEVKPDVQVRFFVIARYNAFFSGYFGHDARATWADWNHFMRARVENPNASVCELAEHIAKEADEIAASFRGESYVIPLSDLAIVLNPTSEPSSLQ